MAGRLLETRPEDPAEWISHDSISSYRSHCTCTATAQLCGVDALSIRRSHALAALELASGSRRSVDATLVDRDIGPGTGAPHRIQRVTALTTGGHSFPRLRSDVFGAP